MARDAIPKVRRTKIEENTQHQPVAFMLTCKNIHTQTHEHINTHIYTKEITFIFIIFTHAQSRKENIF